VAFLDYDVKVGSTVNQPESIDSRGTVATERIAAVLGVQSF